MKHLGLLLLLLLSVPAHALIVSVNGHGEIPAEGMYIELAEPEQDILTGALRYKLDGSLISTNPLTVTITRSETNIADEFCCAGECTAGNGEISEEMHFNTNGLTNWFIHYTPASNSDITVTYTFSDGTDSRTLTVNYVYNTEDIEPVTGNPSSVTRKILRDGIIYIETENTIYHL